MPSRLDQTQGSLEQNNSLYYTLLVTYKRIHTTSSVGRTRGGVVNAPGPHPQRVRTRVISGLPGPHLDRCLNHRQPHRMQRVTGSRTGTGLPRGGTQVESPPALTPHQ
jgi:hypothetical protein